MIYDEIRGYLDSIDFSPIVKRLIRGNGWLKEEAIEIVELYKRFLFLQKKYGADYLLVPTPDIDEVWHAHILYTKEYHELCIQLFGKYFHHQPEETMSHSILQVGNLKNGFDVTQRLYFREFAEYIPDVRAYNFIGRILVFVIKLSRKIARFYSKKTISYSLRKKSAII